MIFLEHSFKRVSTIFLSYFENECVRKCMCSYSNREHLMGGFENCFLSKKYKKFAWSPCLHNYERHFCTTCLFYTGSYSGSHGRLIPAHSSRFTFKEAWLRWWSGSKVYRPVLWWAFLRNHKIYPSFFNTEIVWVVEICLRGNRGLNSSCSVP